MMAIEIAQITAILLLLVVGGIAILLVVRRWMAGGQTKGGIEDREGSISILEKSSLLTPEEKKQIRLALVKRMEEGDSELPGGRPAQLDDLLRDVPPSGGKK